VMTQQQQQQQHRVVVILLVIQHRHLVSVLTWNEPATVEGILLEES